MNVVVLVSGSGSNLRALFEATLSGVCRARLCAVVADREGTPALLFARDNWIPTRIINPKEYPSLAVWDEALSDTVSSFEPGLLVLAGFMRILRPRMISTFSGRVINVHPSLLPSFPGKDAPKQAIEKLVSFSGCTVHVVDSGVDTGKILAQSIVPVFPNDDPSSLHTRIQVAEHALLPSVVEDICSGKIVL